LFMKSPLLTIAQYQPAFAVNPNGEYELDEFLALYDRTFVWAAYAAILRREPDPEGEAHFLQRVRSGEDKATILDLILGSPEGRKHKTLIRGLSEHMRLVELCKRPIVGKLVAAYFFLSTIEIHMRDLRILENHMIRLAEETRAIHQSNIKELRNLIR